MLMYMSEDTKLSKWDRMDLVNEYRSELRKLNYKTEHCRQRVKELEAELENEDNDVSETLERRIIIGKTRKVRKKELKPRKPYPLSDWDMIILQVIKDGDHAMLSKDIYDGTFERAKLMGVFSDEKKAKAKVNQCLVKLANRRGDLVKIKYSGRGFAYGYPEWLDTRGKLKKDHAIIYAQPEMSKETPLPTFVQNKAKKQAVMV
jgi:hypothetical protein